MDEQSEFLWDCLAAELFHWETLAVYSIGFFSFLRSNFPLLHTRKFSFIRFSLLCINALWIPFNRSIQVFLTANKITRISEGRALLFSLLSWHILKSTFYSFSSYFSSWYILVFRKIATSNPRPALGCPFPHHLHSQPPAWSWQEEHAQVGAVTRSAA